jgi:hypothetical protein
LQVVLRLVVDGELAAARPHVRRVDADPAVARAAPIGDARPADAIFHADVERVGATRVIEMVARVGEEALPRIFKPGGDLLGLRVGGNPVLQRIVDAVFGVVDGDGDLGVPHAHGLVDATHHKGAGDALIEDGAAGQAGAAGACRMYARRQHFG